MPEQAPTDGPVAEPAPSEGEPSESDRPETAIAFRRPPAQFVPQPDWFIEDTQEQEPIERNPPVAVPDYAPAASPRRRRWSARRILVVGALVALTAAGASSVALRYHSAPVSTAATGVEARPASNFPTLAGPPAAPAPSPSSSRVASAPLGGALDREFDLVTATSTVTVSTADLAGRLFVVTTPAGGDALPSAVVDASRVQLQLVPSGTHGPGAVEIKLNSRVRWHLRLSGGAVEQLIDMTSGRLSGIDINGGATLIDLSLPAPSGTIPVRMTGGANQFLLHLHAGIPVRVRVRSGASSVNIDALNRSSIAPGTLFTPAGWDSAANRYDIDAVAGFATLSVDRA